MPSSSDLEKAISINFRDKALLELALIHSSYINEKPGTGLESNERLEFLGDAVLGLMVAEALYQKFPGFTEGQMTTVRSALVRRSTLARMANSISLGRFLYMGKGEQSTGGREKPANLAGAFEALLGAIYLDQGLETVRGFILKMIGPEMDKEADQGKTIDYKSQLQQLVQAKAHTSLNYRLIESSGPDHARTFAVEVRLGEVVLGKGTGNSKKAAETEAARTALENLPASFTD